MMKLNGFKFKKMFLPILGFLLVLGAFLVFNFTRSQILADDSELELDSDLIYYINVTYDGKDRNGVSSNGDVLSNVYSEDIYVEDILPADLTFEHFLVTDDGSIGAVEQGTERGCLGQVIDDSSSVLSSSTLINTKGLHYETETRKVSFRVRGLQAGCQLSVGVVTKTPQTVDDKSTPELEVRRDIYNTALAKENKQVVISNTVHGFMGISDEFVKFYTVNYKYDKEYLNAPSLPEARTYVENATVTIPMTPMLDGYVFKGWKSEEVTLINGTFKMPAKDVTLVGSFEKLKDYTVSYKIEGEVPEGYEVPTSKSYYVGDKVGIDSTKSGFVYNGYKFMGWSLEGVSVKDGEFMMPEHDVEIIGRFEKVKYKLSYQFTSEVKPDNANDLLPATQEYAEGDKVKLKSIDAVPNYVFMGWLYDNEFVMPARDVVVDGEWMKVNGWFTPAIRIVDVTGKASYKPGDVVDLSITVTNNESYDIRNVQVKNSGNLKLVASTGYTIRNDRAAEIEQIDAGSSILLKAKYLVSNRDSGMIREEVMITSALADNDYLFDDRLPLKATVEILVSSSVKICNVVNHGTGDENFGFSITGSGYETWVSLKNQECKTIYVHPGDYTVKEIVPQEFRLDKNNYTVHIGQGDTVTLNFTNSYTKHNFYHSVKWLFKKIKGEDK